MAVTESTITPKLDLKVEKNSKGFNWEMKLSEANGDTFSAIDHAFELLDHARKGMEKRFGGHDNG